MRIRLKVLVLAGFCVLLLGYVGYLQFSYQDRVAKRYDATLASLEKIKKYSNAIHALQKERGLSVGYVRKLVDGETTLLAQRKLTDAAVAALVQSGADLTNMRLLLQRVRSQADGGQVEDKAVFYNYTQIITGFINTILFINLPTDELFFQEGKRDCLHLLYAGECLGKIRALLYRDAANASLSSTEAEELLHLINLYDYHINSVVTSKDVLLAKEVKAFQKASANVALEAYIIQSVQRGRTSLDPDVWFAMSTRGIATLKKLQFLGFEDLQVRAREVVSRQRQQFFKAMAVLSVVTLAVLLLTVVIVLRILHPLNVILHFVENSIGSGDVSRRVELRAENEFGVIARGINALLELSNKLINEKEFLAFHDQLTGAYTRLRFNALFESELQKHLRYNHLFSFIIFDIDHFKNVNDSFGHQAGDVVLQEIAGLVQKNIRITDIFGRWGGEEFVLLLPETEVSGGVSLAEKLRNCIEEHAFPAVGRVTVSLGLAVLEPGDTLGSLCAKADQALYQAKKTGRNKTCVYETPEAT